MLFGAEGAMAADGIIKHAANQKSGLNIAASSGKTKFGSNEGADTMQTLSVKLPFGRSARTHRRTTEEESTTVVMKSQVAQISRASAQPATEAFLDESLTPIPSMDLKEVHRLARFLPVVVLIPGSTGAHQLAPHKPSVAESSGERSETTIFGALGKAVERFVSSTVTFGDVTVNFSTMEVLRKGEPVVLKALEFKTLKYLIQNARRVISRDEMLNEVWGYENYPCTRTVDNHILRLRQKLERNPSRPVHFRTMHGTGYKFLP
jgi:Transcriptional regulatory protein, C terminal